MIPGATVTEGAKAKAVWQEITSAVALGGGWLTRGEEVPVRPLRSPEERSPGWHLAIEDSPPSQSRADKVPCRFCDFKQLCGVQGVV